MEEVFPYSLSLYDTSVSASGDQTVTLAYTIPADYELMDNHAHSRYVDSTGGGAVASIPPEFSTIELEGKLTKIQDDWYRVSEVRPIDSIVTNELEFIDLVLDKVEAPDAGNL